MMIQGKSCTLTVAKDGYKGFREDTRSKKRTIRGYGGGVWTIGVPIPQNCISLKDLSSKMIDSEKYLKKILHEEIDKVS